MQIFQPTGGTFSYLVFPFYPFVIFINGTSCQIIDRFLPGPQRKSQISIAELIIESAPPGGFGCNSFYQLNLLSLGLKPEQITGIPMNPIDHMFNRMPKYFSPVIRHASRFGGIIFPEIIQPKMNIVELVNFLFIGTITQNISLSIGKINHSTPRIDHQRSA